MKERVLQLIRTFVLAVLLTWSGHTIFTVSPLLADEGDGDFWVCTRFPWVCLDWAGGWCEGDCIIRHTDACCWK